MVAASKAPVLKLTILSETKKYLRKELSSSYVESLEIDAPCTVCIEPKMENLREVIVKPKSKSGTSVCSFWKSKSDDRDMHRAGLCCVNIGSVFNTCPKLVRFMGVEVESVMTKNRKFTVWNAKMKKAFYEIYTKSGGSLEFKTWCKRRWFAKQPCTPCV